ncbi:MAG TPA: AAA family ATPase [Ramlibacter sp.]|nr:AAA family ATPase [Ramlibacter sp.]
MECRACHARNREGNAFCEGCGAPLASQCPTCGAACGPQARFCGRCGTPLAVLGVSSPHAAAGWGELKHATVLFADIVSSTEQIARLDPEEAMERLKPAVLLMCGAVERFGGTVMRTLGDGVMALFGVPKALEGHARLASQAALHMQSAFQQRPGGFSIRIGLHSGLVASDPHSPDVGKGGGAHGMTIHLASRVIGLAEPGGICLTDACRSLLGADCEVYSLGEHALKGIAKPTLIHRLEGLRPAASASLGDKAWATHFRGREPEVEQLKAALRSTEEGRTRVASIVGEPGAGKSRLCHEFAKVCRAQGIPVCEVGVQLYGHATPLQPILELLRSFYFGLADTDPPESARSDVASVLQKVDCSQEEIALMCEFLGLVPQEESSAQGPQTRHRQVLSVFSRLVRSNPEACAVLLIEDLHWLDEASEEFVAALVDSVVGTRTFLVLNYRPQYQPSWAKAGHHVGIEVSELGSGDMEVLVSELVGHAPHLAELRRLITLRSAGNPFFAEELSRALVDSGLLSVQGEPDLAEIEAAMPATVQAVIAARIDNLGEPEKTLLQMCAIIGKDIPLAVLQNVATPLSAVIDRGLGGLCAAGLIVQESTAGRRHFTFRHPLIQEVAYGAQLKVRRQVLHAAVAQSMESYYRGQLDEYAGLIAYHYEAAKRNVDAASYLAKAARWVGATDPSRALKLWYRVRTLLKPEPRSAETDRLQALAGGRIVYLGWREGLSLEEVREIVDQALALASERDARLVQLLLFAHGRILQSSGGPADGFVASLQRALAMSPASADEGRLATLNLALSHAYAWAGRLKEGLEANDRAVAGLQKIDSFDRDFIGFSVEQWALGIRVRLMNRLGMFEESRKSLMALHELTGPAGDPLLRQIAHHAVVDLAWFSSDPSVALHHCKEVTSIAQQQGTPYSRIFAMVCTGVAQLTLGCYDEAKEAFLEGLALVRRMKVAVDFEAEILAGLAESALGNRQWQQAAAWAAEAVKLASARSNRIAECRAHMAAAVALASLDPRQRVPASRALEQARALVEFTGASALAPRLAQARAALQPLNA